MFWLGPDTHSFDSAAPPPPPPSLSLSLSFFLINSITIFHSLLIVNCNFVEAGEMLHVAEAFIDKRYHPTVICRGNISVF